MQPLLRPRNAEKANKYADPFPKLKSSHKFIKRDGFPHSVREPFMEANPDPILFIFPCRPALLS